MLEKSDLSKTISKDEYKAKKDALIIELGALQRELKTLGIPTLIVFEGWDAAGKGTLINNLLLPLDPRGVNVSTFAQPSREETLRPYLWRYWVRTPATGRIEIFDRSLSHDYIDLRAAKKCDKDELLSAYNEVRAFERTLAENGTIILKYFLDISKKEQRKRFKRLRKNAATKWRVGDDDMKRHKQYKKYRALYNTMLTETHEPYAEWTVIPAEDKRYAKVALFTSVIERLTKERDRVLADRAREENKDGIPEIVLPRIEASILDAIDLNKTLERDVYRKKLDDLQRSMRNLEHKLFRKRVPVIIAFEGSDAAGKGGSIRRLVETMDPRGYDVIPVAAPNDIEKAHHYLWRFWREIPKKGHIAIFDRTWYGRVLVERVEGFCPESAWRRAYQEINEMEATLSRAGAVVIKFWLQIDKDEQYRRFKERENNPHKTWKITDEDWRNREKWDLYRDAVDEMLHRTTTIHAPWTVVESNSKYFARIKVLETVKERIEERL